MANGIKFNNGANIRKVADKAEALTITPVDGEVIYIYSDDGQGGNWNAVTGAAASTYSNNSATDCGTIIIPTGGDGSAAWVKDSSDLAVANKSAALLLTPYDLQTLNIAGADGGSFRAVTGAAASTYSSDGGSYCGTVIVPTGGDGSAAWLREADGAVNVKWFGTTGDGTTDDTAAIKSAFDSVTGNADIVIPQGTYICGAPLDLNLKSYTSVSAYGSIIEFTADGGGIDLNTSDTAQIIMIRWLGGKIYNSAGTKLASTGIEIDDMRNLEIRDVHFQGFFKAILLSGRDSFNFTSLHFFDNTYSIYIDTSIAPVPGLGCLINNIQECHFSIGGETAGIYAVGGWYGVNIANCSFNGAAVTSVFCENIASFSNRGFSVKSCHFEQGDATSTYIHLKDSQAGAGASQMRGIAIQNNTFGDSLPDSIILENASGIEIASNAFAQTIGAGVPITLNASCKNAVISASNVYSSSYPVLLCDRDTVVVGMEIRRVPNFPLASLNGSSFSTSSATLDMSTEVAAYYPVEAVPKGYWLTVQAKDSNSAANASPRVDFYASTVATAARRAMIRIGGMPSDILVGSSFYVPADANGDIDYNFVASGASTLDVYATLTGIEM